MLAADLVPELRGAGHDVVALGRADLDITDAAAVTAALRDVAPAVVVNTAAYTRVDDAESHEHEAYAVNAVGAGLVAQACATASTRPVLLHISTDYVFAGDAREPYAEDAEPAPRTAYGRTKLAGERAVLATLPERGYVVRTAWLYGAHGPSFVATMLRLEREQETIDVVADQHGQPTSTLDLARRLRELGEAALTGGAQPGVYHATNSGITTWYGLACAVYEHLGADPERVRPVTSAQYRRPAPRPAWSVLADTRSSPAGVAPMRAWRAALAEAMPALMAVQS